MSALSTQVPLSLAVLADPPTRMVDSCAMDYLLIEAVNALRASSAVASARAKKVEQEMIDAGLIPAPAPVLPPLNVRGSASGSVAGGRDSVGGTSSSKNGVGSAKPVGDEDEAVRARLESIGMHVGANFAERLCRDKPLFTETLDAIKFICKDVWAACWEKQVDNLRTNHRGVYVLQDNSFKPISRLSSWEGRADALHRAKLFVAMPAGIIRGALSRLGLHGTVVAEITSLPQCTFQIKLPKTT